jgi:hypothetical protein
MHKLPPSASMPIGAHGAGGPLLIVNRVQNALGCYRGSWSRGVREQASARGPALPLDKVTHDIPFERASSIFSLTVCRLKSGPNLIRELLMQFFSGVILVLTKDLERILKEDFKRLHLRPA